MFFAHSLLQVGIQNDFESYLKGFAESFPALLARPALS